MSEAPYYGEVVGGPERVDARWLQAGDGVRLRAAAWPGPDRGTVLIFSGRTEYVEKYAHAALELAGYGFSSACIDWRGQGLSDRALEDTLTGHVADFLDYQEDVASFVGFVRALGLPEPYHLLAHSMGGAIGLRALHRRLDVANAVFSAPMWGIGMSPMTRPLAWSVSWMGRAIGRGDRYTPGTSAASYVGETEFEANLLTADPEMFGIMQAQMRAHPELSLGGPSLSWLFAALREMRSLRALAPPAYPALALLGTEEAIIDPAAVRAVMQRWPEGRLEMLEGARHEIMMERPSIRDRVFSAAADHFFDGSASRAA